MMLAVEKDGARARGAKLQDQNGGREIKPYRV